MLARLAGPTICTLGIASAEMYVWAVARRAAVITAITTIQPRTRIMLRFIARFPRRRLLIDTPFLSWYAVSPAFDFGSLRSFNYTSKPAARILDLGRSPLNGPSCNAEKTWRGSLFLE